MKVEIDLKEILTDEYGDGETLAQSIRRQVIEKLTEKASEGIQRQINSEVSQVLQESLKTAVAEKMPALLEDLMNAEYQPVNNWGERGKSTTFRKQLVETIMTQMNYKKESYDGNKNAFTKAVDQVVAENVKAMQKEFDKQVIEMFQKQAFEYAMKQMAAKLQVTV